jgi:hypothetical protein
MIYALIILLFSGVIINILSKKYSLYKLIYKRNISKSTVEINEEFEITTIIENEKIIPVLFLQVVEKIPFQLTYKFKADVIYGEEHIHHTTTMFLMPKQRIKRTFKVFLKQRGLYLFSDVTLIAGDFLGLTTTSMQQEYLQEVVVYPSSLNIEKELKPFGSYYGDISVKRWIISDPILTIGIREYTGYEPQNSIHWPSSLKTGMLMVKNYDYTTDNKVMIVLSIECSRPFWSNIDMAKIEKFFSITRSIMEELEGLGIPYSFVTNIQSNESGIKESYIPYGYGAVHFYDILEFLGRANYNVSIFFEKVLDNLINTHEKSITYVLITPKLLNEYIDSINQLSINVEKTIVISIGDENINKLNEKIISFIGKEC